MLNIFVKTMMHFFFRILWKIESPKEQHLFEIKVTLYFRVFLLQCKYTFKYWVILINNMHLLNG